MQPENNTVLENLRSLKEDSVAYSHLGQNKDFTEAEQAKNEFCEHAIELLQLSGEDKSISGHLTTDVKRKVDAHANHYKNLSKEISNCTDPESRKPNNFDFQQERQKLIDRARSHLDQFLTQTINARTIWRVNQFEKLIDTTALNAIRSETNSLVQECSEAVVAAQEAKKKTEELLADLGEKIEQKTIEDAADDFDKLADAHRKHERFWALLLLLMIGGFAWSIFVAYSNTTTILGDDIQSIKIDPLVVTLLAIRNLLFLSLTAVGIKISLTKYNVERNLHVIYRHRETALSQYNLLKDRLAEDPDSQRQLLLEVTKLLFADPATGLTKQPVDLNVNPVLNVVGKALGS